MSLDDCVGGLGSRGPGEEGKKPYDSESPFIVPGMHSKIKRDQIGIYDPEDIIYLIRRKKSDEYIYQRYKINPPELSALKAHITMGSYGRGKGREIDEKEINEIYKRIERGDDSEAIARDFRIPRIRVMGFKAAYTKNKKKRDK